MGGPILPIEGAVTIMRIDLKIETGDRAGVTLQFPNMSLGRLMRIMQDWPDTVEGLIVAAVRAGAGEPDYNEPADCSVELEGWAGSVWIERNDWKVRYDYHEGMYFYDGRGGVVKILKTGIERIIGLYDRATACYD